MVNVSLSVRDILEIVSVVGLHTDLGRRLGDALVEATQPAQTNITVKSIPKDQKIWVIKHIRDTMEWDLTDANDFCKGIMNDGVSDTLVGPSKMMDPLAESLRSLGCEIYIDHWGS